MENKHLKLAVFKGKNIRRTIHKNEWWFSVVDICGALTESTDPGAYWRKLKQRLIQEGSEVVTNCHGLKLTAPDGKKRETDCANTEGLTDEWQKRGVEQNREYAILTAEIHEATFGLKPGEHKELKGIDRENLRDHMTNLEQIFTMLGEASTTEIARTQDAKGFDENKDAAKAGGKIAGNARKELEGGHVNRRV